MGLFFYLRTVGQKQTVSQGSPPTLVAVHTLYPSAAGAGGLHEQALGTASWAVGVSRSILAEAHALRPEIAPRSSLVHNALPMPAVAPLPLPAAPPRIVCVGRMVPEKGFDVALAAFASVVGRVPGAELVIAGDGYCREGLERQAAALGLGESVRFIGWVPPDRTPELLNQATLVVMPSRWQEPFGLVALEAAQMATRSWRRGSVRCQRSWPMERPDCSSTTKTAWRWPMPS